MVLIVLLAALAIMTVPFCTAMFKVWTASGGGRPGIEAIALGAVTNFFDTLGIGSFAPTMAWFKLRRSVPDRLIPATMLIGHALPTVVQAAIFLVLLGVKVDPVLLVGCIAALTAGGAAGVPLAAKLPLRAIQAAVGIALFAGAGV